MSLFVIISVSLFSQTLSPTVIAPAGGYSTGTTATPELDTRRTGYRNIKQWKHNPDTGISATWSAGQSYNEYQSLSWKGHFPAH